jgi:hypothetical protein
MAAVLFHEPVFATIVESGDKLYFYEVGTTNTLTVYTDFALTAPATNPLIADSDGRFVPIYIDATTNDPKVVLTDSADVQKWTLDRYPIEDITTLANDVDQAELDIAGNTGRLTVNESDIDQLETDVAALQGQNSTYTAGFGLDLSANEFSLDAAYGGPPSVVFADVHSQSSSTALPSGVFTPMPTQTLIRNAVGATINGNFVHLPEGSFYYEFICPLKCSKSDTVGDVRTALFNVAGTQQDYGQAQPLGDWQTLNYHGCGIVVGNDDYQVRAYTGEGSTKYRPSGGAGQRVATIIKFWKIS